MFVVEFCKKSEKNNRDYQTESLNLLVWLESLLAMTNGIFLLTVVRPEFHVKFLIGHLLGKLVELQGSLSMQFIPYT